jgi:hypothetical protein
MDLGKLAVAARGLLVAVAGVILAWLWFDNLAWLAAVLAVLAGVSSLVAYQAGVKQLPGRPAIAAELMGAWALTEATIAAIAAAAVVIIAVALTVPSTDPAATRQLFSSLATGVTAFLTSTFISWSSDTKDTSVGNKICQEFQAHFKRGPGPAEAGVHYFAADSPGERWVYDDTYGGVTGWGAEARRRRARAIAGEMQSHASDYAA